MHIVRKLLKNNLNWIVLERNRRG